MGRVHRIEIENFKSYRGRHVIGPFEQFTCIIGPNGSGKSNLMDAFSFVLAIPSKYLRSQNLQELVYSNENDDYSANTCSVSLFYIADETDHELNKEVSAGEEIEFFRRVNANGSSQYKINGKQVTNDNYIQTLSGFNILVSCRNFLVYQGDVQNIATRSPEELTVLFEQISGSYNLRSEYEQLRDQREKLKAVMDMSLKKKYNMISERNVVQEQKEEADEFQKKLGLLRDLRVEYFLWQLFNIESNLEEHSKKSKSIEEKENEIEENDSGYRQEKEVKQREMVQIQESFRQKEAQMREIEDSIKQKEPERMKLTDRLRRFDVKKRQTTEEDAKLQNDLHVLEREDTELEDQLNRMNASLEALEAATPQTQSGIVLSEEQKEQYNQLKQQYLADAGSLLQKNEILKREEETLVSRINQKTEVLNNYKQEEENTRKLVEELHRQESQLTSTLKDVVDLITSLESESRQLNNEYSTSLQALQEKRQQLEEKKKTLQGDLSVREGQRRDKERRACVSRLQELFPEVQGLLIDLINPIQKKYSVAVETALGNHLDAVVVNSKAVAIECIQFLKEQHMSAMDFYPLDSLKPKELRLDLRHQNCKLCYELLDFDASIEVAVRYAVGNTVVADTLQTARQLAYEQKLGEKIVTLDGKEIAKNGAMTGGVGKTEKGNKFQDKIIQKKQEEIEKLEKEIQELEKKLQRSAASSERMRGIESSLLTQRSKQRVFTEEISVLQGKKAEYGNRINALTTSIKRTMDELEELQQEENQKTNELSVLYQKLNLVEKRVYGAFLDEVGASSVKQLENEYMSKLRENERVLNECMTHITLIEDKKAYGRQRMETIRTTLRDNKTSYQRIAKKMEETDQKARRVSLQVQELEDRKESINKVMVEFKRKKKDLEVVIAEIDTRIRSNRASLKKLEDQLSSERSAMETLRAKRNAVLKSAMMEQIQIPFLHARDSQRTSSVLEDSMEMEIEPDPVNPSDMEVETPMSQRFSQSQAAVVQNDQDQIDQIDFSSLGTNAVAVSESEYGKKDEQYRDQISKLAMEIDKIQPNMLAEQKFKDLSEKVTLMNQDRKEMIANYNKANDAFKACSKKRKELFMEAYQQVESVIDETYKQLTRSVQFAAGGQALLSLTNPEEPFMGGIKYTVSPVGKQYRDISQLSGGEKTIATLALLFALHSYRRAPFFIMDEVDDALDNANVERVAKYVLESSKQIQCIVISHKELLFERSDSLVGVYHNWKEASSAVLTLDMRKYDTFGNFFVCLKNIRF